MYEFGTLVPNNYFRKKSPFGRCHILRIFFNILFFTLQKYFFEKNNSLGFRHLFFELFLAEPNLHNILEPVLGRPSEKESKTTMIPKVW
jgi:hypothetical protein